MPDVRLHIGGAAYGGWKEIRVTRSIETVSGSFDLKVTERWPEQSTPRKIRRGDACVLRADGDLLITGYVDEGAPSFDDKEHTVTVTGRDKTGDLVDCSAICGSGQWNNRTARQICADICKPFGIPVTANADVGKVIGQFALQPGETAFEAIERVCRYRALLPVSDSQGGLLLTRAGTARVSTPLIEGENCKRGSAQLGMKDRYSKYIIKGQAAGDDFSTPEQNAQPQAYATDPGVTRYRPLIVIAEGMGNGVTYKDRARWEAAVRAGRSSRATVTVQGWHHKTGPWTPNTIVPCRLPSLDIQRDMLLVAVNSIIDENGTVSELTITDPAAFKLLPLAEAKKG
ncbi:MAG: contractile injection system protein, VgrG/Pvc8 family [Desulfobulbaceae bacterium]|nr:contractile injection system protein, VgrG/Pvc8 family [Desulfobulbaceae bacterium]